MRRAFGALASAFYALTIGGLVFTHLYATVLAYQYVYAWHVKRALLWVFLTFFVPVLSTAVWFVIHWVQTSTFWNSLTLILAASLGCLAAGMLSERIEQAVK